MSRTFTVALIATLVLPVLALAALVGQQEYLIANARILNVPLVGYDPRDLLRGQYIAGQFDWDWAGGPSFPQSDGAVCVLQGDAPKPRVRFIAGWKAGDPADSDCRMIVAGRGEPGRGSVPARFAPTGLDQGNGTVHIFVPEDRASDLERLIRDRPGALTVDLAVRANGRATIAGLRVNGQRLGR
ncbi:MAG: GDYXXLXY domain-containing protein [Alphaproteobacteria bacterium]|nr:GDYXXLXY domain-containing protein [Alphaproteobacteria bacterium]